MGRKPRVEFYGAIYHVIQRGNNRSYIFRESEHKEKMLEIVMETRNDSDFRFLAHVIMDNHYHFIIQTMNERISKVMHRINNRYSKYYNGKEMRTGVNFGERYYCKLVEDKGYLLKLLYYIHHNPVKANIVDNVFDYGFSSDKAYRNNDDSQVNINYILNIFLENRVNAIEKYCEMMDGIEPVDQVEKEIKAMFETYIAIRYKGKNLDCILMNACPSIEEFNLIKNKSKCKFLTSYKVKYVKNSVLEHYTYEEIGRNINITGSAVVKLLQRKDGKWLRQSIVTQSQE